MLSEGRIPLSEAEHQAVDKLIAENVTGKPLSFTRRDPGETGPLIVTVGSDEYQIDEEGHRRKLKSDG